MVLPQLSRLSHTGAMLEPFHWVRQYSLVTNYHSSVANLSLSLSALSLLQPISRTPLHLMSISLAAPSTIIVLSWQSRQPLHLIMQLKQEVALLPHPVHPFPAPGGHPLEECHWPNQPMNFKPFVVV